MTKPILFLLELVRIVIFLAIGYGILGWVEQLIYSPFRIKIDNYFLYYLLGNLLILFILYRNVFQFRGWFKSEKNKKLPRTLTTFLSIAAICLLFFPIVW
ncbi:hypothetical protein GQF01_05795 [Paenibacillus sp. 5J-6]|uniref:Uncharacterized protein n=1 Tax=Paenibacillus silvestris TaxID=2606219 RepID=A0A6L8UUU2_9BACL|nr:hypothetical protein [Paenibacillus silvestris]MZQ81644.1 hypothetical protein [Paenibacillus silvestris]